MFKDIRKILKFSKYFKIQHPQLVEESFKNIVNNKFGGLGNSYKVFFKNSILFLETENQFLKNEIFINKKSILNMIENNTGIKIKDIIFS